MPFSLTLTPSQYECVKEKLNNVKSVDISVGKDNPNYGIIKTSSVQAEFVYNPETSTLTFQNEHLHGFAKLASETTIESHVTDFIRELNCPALENEANSNNNPPTPPSQPAPANGSNFTPNARN